MLNEENKGSSFSGLCFWGSSFSLQPYFIIIEVAYKCKKIASIKISFIDISSYNLSSLRLNSNDVYHRKKKKRILQVSQVRKIGRPGQIVQIMREKEAFQVKKLDNMVTVQNVR